MKILELLDGAGWCGTKEQTYLITRELSKYHKVELALAFEHDEMISRLLGRVPLRFYQRSKDRLKNLNPGNYVRLYRILRDGRYDVVIANSSKVLGYLCLVLPWLRRRPRVVAMKRSGFRSTKLSKNLKYRCADRIVVVSSEIKQTMVEQDFFPERLVTIESGIELSRFKPDNIHRSALRQQLGLNPGQPVFINVANWQLWRKAQDVLLAAFEKIKHRDCKLLLVGAGTDSDAAKQLIAKHGLQNKVIGLGFRRDVEKLLQAADFFIFTSHSEGIAGALLQAMASAKVVVSTPAGGIVEYLQHNENGFLTPLDDTNALAWRMDLLLSMPQSRYEELAANAAATASKYSMERNLARWLELLEEFNAIPEAGLHGRLASNKII